MCGYMHMLTLKGDQYFITSQHNQAQTRLFVNGFHPILQTKDEKRKLYFEAALMRVNVV